MSTAGDLDVEVTPPYLTESYALYRRLSHRDASAQELHELNRRLLERINSKKRVFLTATTLDNRYVLRLCVLSFRTHLERVQAALEDIRASIAEIRPQTSALEA